MQAVVPTGAYALPQLSVIELAEPTDAPRGKRWYPPVFPGKPRQVELSPRMAEVLTGVMQGLTAKQIGKSLWLTEDTVKTHAKRLYQRLGARSQAHAVTLFMSGEVEIHVAGYQVRRKPPTVCAPGDDDDEL